MEDYMKDRPKKNVFPKSEQREILKRAKEFVLGDLLPNPKINKIILFGSLIEGKFGEYGKPYKDRKYSDVDVLLFVEEDFEVPDDWGEHFHCDMYDVYNARMMDGKILVQYMVCRKSSYQNKEYQKESEKWGVPLSLEKSKHRYIVIYEK